MHEGFVGGGKFPFTFEFWDNTYVLVWDYFDIELEYLANISAKHLIPNQFHVPEIDLFKF
jgi:hypothetical protein